MIRSVLYVDDDPDICEVVETTLCTMTELCVHTAASGTEAIFQAREVHPDLVLMDIMMPGLDGPSTLQRMRADPSLAHIPVIFMTAKLLPAEVAHFLHLGAIGVIGKPFDPLTLGKELFSLWAKAGPARATPARHDQSSPVQIEAKVSSLAGAFLERTAADAVRLREMIARAGRGERSALQEIEQLAHKIHGSGALFGYPEISASGAAIERLAMANTEPPIPASALGTPQQLKYRTQQLALAVQSAQRAWV